MEHHIKRYTKEGDCMRENLKKARQKAGMT